jgi:hypothetical protein
VTDTEPVAARPSPRRSAAPLPPWLGGGPSRPAPGYAVEAGDTLWDIAAARLARPLGGFRGRLEGREARPRGGAVASRGQAPRGPYHREVINYQREVIHKDEAAPITSAASVLRLA